MFTLGAVLICVSSCQASGWGSDGTAPIVSPAAGGGLTNFSYCNTNYDFYLARVGAFADTSNFNDYSAPASSGYDSLPNIEAAHNSYFAGHGVGAGAYVFLSGLGVGTKYNPAETPYNWGVQQAQWATDDYNQAFESIYPSDNTGFSFSSIMGDIEPSVQNPYGWNVGTPTAPLSATAITANQQVWQGFVTTLQNAGTNVMLYSDPDVWNYDFGGNSFPVTTVEDTFQQDYGPYSPCPQYPDNSTGPGGTNAQWFDVTSTNNELVWQWSNTGSSYNTTGDFDIINITNYNTVFNTADNP